MTRFIKTQLPSATLIAMALVGAAVIPNVAAAQQAPTGYVYDVTLASGYGPASSSYTLYKETFTATLAETTVAWAFREDPGYVSFDDASVSLAGGGPNLLSDPGFESAALGSDAPPAWTVFATPDTIGPTGVVQSSATTEYGTRPHTGSNYWFDGSIGGYDGLAQTIHTTIGQAYTISFYLADTSGHNYCNNYYCSPYLDASVYAGNGLPQGVKVFGDGVDGGVTLGGVPEPATWAAMLLGFGGIGASMRSRRAQQRSAA
jgi:hypothetical protein